MIDRRQRSFWEYSVATQQISALEPIAFADILDAFGPVATRLRGLGSDVSAEINAMLLSESEPAGLRVETRRHRRTNRDGFFVKTPSAIYYAETLSTAHDLAKLLEIVVAHSALGSRLN